MTQIVTAQKELNRTERTQQAEKTQGIADPVCYQTST